MRTNQYTKQISTLALVALTSYSSFAQNSASDSAEVKAANISGKNVGVGAPVTVLLEFNVPQPWCGLEIQWGDGEDNTVRVGHEKNNTFPLQLTHAYKAPGQFTIKIVGKQITRGLKSAGPCGGLPKQTAVVVTSEQQKAEEERSRTEANRTKEEADRRARELEEKEAELRRREDKLEKDRRAQEKREQELKARQKAVENKASSTPAPIQPTPQPAPSKKPTIDPF